MPENRGYRVAPVTDYPLRDHLGSSRMVLDAGGTITAQNDYEPFGDNMVVGGATYNERLGFTGKETDKESKLGDFGVRKYTGGRFWSCDPLWEKFPTSSPYVYADNSPLNMIDPTGKSGVSILDKGSKTITVHSKFVFYGGAASTELSRAIANEIAEQYNRANGKVMVDGVEYSVKFKITYQTVTEAKAIKMAAGNSDAKINFMRVEKNNSRFGRSFNELGNNSGFLNTDDDLGKSTTAPHEVGHGYGLTHTPDDQRGSGRPDIMAARGTLVDSEYQYDATAAPGAAGGTVNPRTRRVTQGNIIDIFKGVTFDKQGYGIIGNTSNIIYDRNGYEQKP